MMSTNTLTSLAILKVNIDQGKNYLDYLVPFVLHTIVEHDPAPITSLVIRNLIRGDFGLEIPDRTVEVVLRRLSRRHPTIKRDHHEYVRTGDIPDPQIVSKRSEAARHIGSVLYGLQEYSQRTPNPITGDEHAERVVSAFLEIFDVSCLRNYLRGTVLPRAEGTRSTDLVLASEYVQHLNRTDPDRFESFIVLVQGHMLANALLCPDLENISNSYAGVTFYFDTPLLVRSLGLEGGPKEDAVRELLAQLKSLGGRFAAFSHSRDELRGVLQGSANNIESPDARGAVVLEARKRGTSRSDLLLRAEHIDEELNAVGISIEGTPSYIQRFQIDEDVFEEALADEVSYLNPRAKQFDINSVRSIFAIRGNSSVPTLEKARAVLVTSNGGFASAAWDYGQTYRPAQAVSSVITDFTLANTAWLKAPMGAPSIPRTQLLALSYAALEPPLQLLEAYLKEIDRLESEGKITAMDHQLLRSSPLVNNELMDLTLGDAGSLTEGTVTETLRRIHSMIQGVASQQLRSTSEQLEAQSNLLEKEQTSHGETLEALEVQRVQNQDILKTLYWRCRRRADRLAWMLWPISVSVVILLTLSTLLSLELLSTSLIPRWVAVAGSVSLGLMTLVRLAVGYSIRDFHSWAGKKILSWLIERESKSVGIDLSTYESR